MNRTELLLLDGLLAKLQRELDKRAPLRPEFEILANARKVVDAEITGKEKK